LWCLVCAPAGAAAAAPNAVVPTGDDEAGEGLSLASMQARWLPALVGARSGTRATLLVCGNCSGGEADALGSAVHAALAAAGCLPLARGELPQQPVRRFRAGECAVLLVGSDDAGQKNSACEMYWPCGEDSLTTRVRGLCVGSFTRSGAGSGGWPFSNCQLGRFQALRSTLLFSSFYGRQKRCCWT
jgi:hypothetical protein